jgi:linoleoyl-CoA desaturase
MRVKFGRGQGFYPVLKERVDAYFRRTGFSRRDRPAMYLKVVLLLAWFLGSYLALVFKADAWWQALLLAMSLGLAMAGLGFNCCHDAAHGAFSNLNLINRALTRAFDLLGMSSYVWHWEHNIFHHSYPNIAGADQNIDIGSFARLSPHQPHRWIHRYQHLYLWLLYGFIHLKWQLFYDYKCLVSGRIGTNDFPRPCGWQLLALLAGKALFYGWAIALPTFFHPLWVTGLFFLVASVTCGIALSYVFQLAHCTESADFLTAADESPYCGREWAVHQVQTTVDFARQSRLWSWYLGGLNFQIEHHLFPQIAHEHYPALAEIVEATCDDFGIRYWAHPSLSSAFASHQRWLYRMGRREPAVEAARHSTIASMRSSQVPGSSLNRLGW